MSLYAADGSTNVTVVDGNTRVGRQAADGSINVVVTDGTTLTGVQHPSGALNVVVATGAQQGQAPSGALYVSNSVSPIPGTIKVTDTVAGFYNFKGSNLSKWSAAETARLAGTRNSRIFCAGDSTTAGVGGANLVPLSNNDISFSYPKQLAVLLDGGWQNAIGTHNVVASGTTQLNFDFRYSRVDADWINNTIGTVGGLFNGPANASGTMIWTPVVDSGSPNGFDTIEVYFARFASTGNIIVQRNGGTIDTVNTSGGTATSSKIITNTLGTGGLSFIGNGTTAQYINGIITYDSTRKQRLVINGGALSWKSGELAGSGQGQTNWTYPAGVNAMAPDVVINSSGINDWNGGITVAQYGTNLGTFNTALTSTSDMIFMSPVPGNPAASQPSYATQQTYVNKMRDQAAALNRPMIDIWRLFGGVYQPSLMFDAKHPNGAGYAVIAAAVQKALAPGFLSL